MPVVMTLLVRDEEDILDANLRYHLAQGVDHFIITDNLSTDATPAIIGRYVDRGAATLIREAEDTYAQSRWVSRMAEMAWSMGAGWVVHSDADEFWMPRGGETLAALLRRQRFRNLVVAERQDFLCLEDGEDPFWRRMVYRKTHSLNPLGKRLPPKVAHRARPGVTVAQGNHAVTGMGWQRRLRGAVEILHFPMRSRGQYIRKIELGGRAYENNTDQGLKQGQTWRSQYRELRETGRLAFVEDNLIPAAKLERLLAGGEAVEDRRLERFLDALPPD